nr:hypothetical protein [Tanacetum cinerariifolium]
STPEFSGPAFDEAVQQAVNALLPGLTAQINNELRQNGTGSNSDQPLTIHTWLEKFGKQKPRSFSFATSPIDAENWIAHIEKLFEVFGCAYEFKARLASYKFKGDALNWWKAFKSEQQKYERKYHTIRQKDGELTGEFMKRFIRLAGFVRKKAGPPEEQAKHFKWALSDWILDGIVNTEFTDRGNDGRNYNRQGGNSSQRFYQQNQDQQYNRSSGSSRQKKYTDYNSPPPPCTVTGTLFMNGRVAFVLFDIGATHSVISVLLSKYINVPPTLLNYTLSISTPMRSLVVIDREYQNCPLQFDDKIRSANLFPLDMYAFDIILGMDWLINHHATIVCHNKSVIFGDLDKPKFVYQDS